MDKKYKEYNLKTFLLKYSKIFTTFLKDIFSCLIFKFLIFIDTDKSKNYVINIIGPPINWLSFNGVTIIWQN